METVDGAVGDQFVCGIADVDIVNDYIVWADLRGDGGLICLGNLDKMRKGLRSGV
jgi:hypothetical protein